jgi:hypothetical protein
MKNMKVQIKPLFEPRDLWVGIYIGELEEEGMQYYNRSIYILPFPMIGIEVIFSWDMR